MRRSRFRSSCVTTAGGQIPKTAVPLLFSRSGSTFVLDNAAGCPENALAPCANSFRRFLMFQIRLVIALLAAVVLLPGSSAAQYNSGDSGEYVILSAQYGTAQHHVDVTNRLKELARQDRTFRMGNCTFGVDPDKGRDKTLRIYARGPNGQERMFEYREGSTVDGSQFRSWGRGEWGNSPWNGGWEGGRRAEQPEMTAAIQHLREAQRSLELASHNKGGHRERAIQLVDQA